MRPLIILFLLASLPCALARDYVVSDVEKLQETADALQAGDTLKLEAGHWPDVQLVLANSGTEDAPITLTAVEPGKAILHGATRIAIGGSHIVIEGLHFQGATTPLPPIQRAPR